MQNIHAHALALVNAAGDSALLERAYADFIHAVLGAPLWSSQRRDGLRIPWRLAREAADHPSLREAFSSPGLYLFGSGAGVPLYWGKAEDQTLKERVMGRYVGGGGSQCQLAVDYEQQLLANGLSGFPKGIGTSNVRRAGALAFARHGIHGIWFTLIPIADRSAVYLLEQRLIAVATECNIRHGHLRLINRHHTRSRRH